MARVSAGVPSALAKGEEVGREDLEKTWALLSLDVKMTKK